MNPIHRKRTLGSLEILENFAGPQAPTLILFHGYGADANDLFPLSQMIRTPMPINWVFPQGPLEIPLGYHMTGRAWFPIDTEALERAMRTGTTRDLSLNLPAGMENAREKALDLIRLLNVPWPHLILGGFSQGAMLATDITLRSATSPAGFVILSGTLLDEKNWKEAAPRRKGLPFFQSHGTQDPLLGFDQAQKLERILKDSGLQGDLLSFQGGHEIPPPVLQGLQDYLSRILKTPQ